MLSASPIGRFFYTVSTLATMSFVGIFFGVTEKFRPFSKKIFFIIDLMSRELYISSNDVLLLLPFLCSSSCCGDCVDLQNVADEA